jgi:hypothetical protein
VKGGVLASPFFNQNSSMKKKVWQKTVFGVLTLFLFSSNGMPSELSDIHTLVEESSPVFASSCLSSTDKTYILVVPGKARIGALYVLQNQSLLNLADVQFSSDVGDYIGVNGNPSEEDIEAIAGKIVQLKGKCFRLLEPDNMERILLRESITPCKPPAERCSEISLAIMTLSNQ